MIKKLKTSNDEEWFGKIYDEIGKTKWFDKKKVIAILHKVHDDGKSYGYNYAQQEFKEGKKKKK